MTTADKSSSIRRPLTWLRRSNWRWRLPISLAVYLVAAAAMALLAEQHSGWLLAVAALLLGGGVVAFHHLINHPQPPPGAVHSATAEAVIIVGGLGVVIWYFAGRPDGIGFIALATIFLGVGELMGALRQTRAPVPLRLWLGVGLGAACVIGVVVGVIGLGHGSLWPVMALAAGLLVSPVAIEFISEEAFDRDWLATTRAQRVLAGGSAAALAVGLAWFVVSGPNWKLLIYGCVALALLVGAIVSDTNADLVGMVVVLLIVLANTPASKPLPVALMPTQGSHVVAVFGDSYTSGEGARTFFVNTNTPGINACRRAPSAYAANLALSGDYAGDKTMFLACSGAVADQLWQTAQAKEDPIDWVPAPGQPALEPGLPQIDRYLFHDQAAPGPHLGLHPDLVVVGIGGNDAGFGDLVQACLVPGDCSKLGARFIDHLTTSTKTEPSVLSSLETAFQKLRHTFGDTPVLAVPYPVPISARTCGASPFTANEARFLNGFTRDLNSVVQTAARNEGLLFLSPMATAFSDHQMQICQTDHRSDAGVNLLVADSVEGNVEQSTDLLNWTHDSMHPNEKGQHQMAVVVNHWLADPNRLHDSTPSSTSDFRTLDQIMGTTTSGVCPTPSSSSCVGQWEQGQVHDLLLRDLIPLGLVFLASWGFWMWGISWWRRRRHPFGHAGAVAPTGPPDAVA